MSFSKPTITHVFENADGTAASGAFEFTLSDVMTNGTTSLTPIPITTNLDNSGNLSQALSSNVDAATWDLAWSGSPTGGTFILAWEGNLSSPLPYNATAAQVQAALQQIQDLQSVVCTGGPLGTTLVIAGVPGNSPITVQNSVSGSASPAVTATQTATGTVPAPPQSTNWRVDMRISGAPVKTWYVVVPAVSGPIDLFSLIPSQQQIN